MARLTSFLRDAAVVALAFVSVANAQVTTTTTTANGISPVATQAWVPNPTCVNGLANPSGNNGFYLDSKGATWQINCGLRQSVISNVIGPYGGNDQGIYGCWKSCDRRPRCVAFYYLGSVTGNTNPAQIL